MAKKHMIMHGPSEVAGQNSYSVRGLKAIGENAESVVYIDHPFGYPYDKCLHVDKSKRLFYPIYALRLAAFFVHAMCRYSVFHFHFGHSILNCVELPLYGLFGKKIFFEFHGSDLRDLKRFCDVSGMPYDPSEDQYPKLRRRNEQICRMADGIIVHDDELIPYLPEVCAPVYVVPLRMDLSQFQPVYPDPDAEKIRIVHAPSKRAGKGTKHVLRAFEQLAEKYDNIELVLVEGKTQGEAFEIYKSADIIVDQLFAGTYGVFAIESMAMGKPVVAYISDEMCECLPKELPIISANKESLEKALSDLVQDGERRHQLGRAGRQYVKTYHDHTRVARILMSIYQAEVTPTRGRQAFRQVQFLEQSLQP